MRFDQHCAGLSGAMEQMAALLRAAPDVAVSAEQAPSALYVPPPGEDLGDGSGAGAAGAGGAAERQGCASEEGDSSPFTQLPAVVPQLPLPLQVG